MPIYVDEITEYSNEFIDIVAKDAQTRRVSARTNNRWCHMWCDSGEEEKLHAIAAHIGMKRAWFQNKPDFPHYDLVPSKRQKALDAGARPMSLRQWLRNRFEQRRKKVTLRPRFGKIN